MKYLATLLIATVCWADTELSINQRPDAVSGEASQPNRLLWEFSCSPIPSRYITTESLRVLANRDTSTLSTRRDSNLGVSSGVRIRDNVIEKAPHEESEPIQYVLRFSIYIEKNLLQTFDKRKSDSNRSRIASKVFRKLYAKISEEFLINNATDRISQRPIPVIFEDNTQAVIWMNQKDKREIRGQIFDTDWNKVGTEIEVSTSTIINIDYPLRIAVLASGSYVVCWITTDNKIYAQIFDKNISRGPEFQVNSESYSAFSPDIVALEGGGFAIVWIANSNIYVKVFNSEGNKVTSKFLPQTSTIETKNSPRVARLTNGNIVLVWYKIVYVNPTGFVAKAYGIYSSSMSYVNSRNIFAEIMDKNWNSVASEFLVNTYTKNMQVNPDVAALKGGGFVVTWNSMDQDGSDWGVFAQVFDSSSNKIGKELQVNQHTQGSQFSESVVALNDGGFLISFRDESGKDGDKSGIFARRYDQNGNPNSNQFQVNQFFQNYQKNSQLAATGCGFIAVWQSQFPTSSNLNIFGRVYYDSPSSLSLKNPLQDLKIYYFQAFSFTVPADTFHSLSGNQLSYSARILVDGQETSKDSFWLSFDPDSRTFSGTPTQQQKIKIQLKASEVCGYILEEFLITIGNSKPIVNAEIPHQVVSFSRQDIWEYYIPENAFKDLERGPIIFTTAVTVINKEEKALDAVWETLEFSNFHGKLYGVPNISGYFTIRIYADDGLGDLDPTPLDMTVEILGQGIELLEFDRVRQRGFKGFISSDNSFFWIAEGSNLNRYDFSSQNPIHIAHSSLQYSFPSPITALCKFSNDRILIGDDQGNIELVSSSSNFHISEISFKKQITDIYCEDSEFIYVSHAYSVSTIRLRSRGLEVFRTKTLDKSVKSIVKAADTIYAGTEDGLVLIDTLTKTVKDLNISDIGYVRDLQFFENSLYVLNEQKLFIFNASNPQTIHLVNSRSLKKPGTSLAVSKIENDLIVLINERENGLELINANNSLNLYSEGDYKTKSAVNAIYISSTGKWGIVLKESEVVAVNILKRNIQTDVCGTNSRSCVQEHEF